MIDDETQKDIVGWGMIILGAFILLSAASRGELSANLVKAVSPMFGLGAALIIGGGAVLKFWKTN